MPRHKDQQVTLVLADVHDVEPREVNGRPSKSTSSERLQKDSLEFLALRILRLMVDTRSFFDFIFFLHHSIGCSGFLLFATIWQGPSYPDDVAGVLFFFQARFFSVQVSDCQNPEEAGLQHSTVYIFFPSAFWFMWTYLLVMRYMLLMLFQVLHVM